MNTLHMYTTQKKNENFTMAKLNPSEQYDWHLPFKYLTNC